MPGKACIFSREGFDTPPDAAGRLSDFDPHLALLSRATIAPARNRDGDRPYQESSRELRLDRNRAPGPEPRDQTGQDFPPHRDTTFCSGKVRTRYM